MHNAVVDTGPLLHLYEIDNLEMITAVFSTIHLPESVVREINNEPILQFIRKNTVQITVNSVSEPDLFATKEKYSLFQLHLADLAVLTLLGIIDDALGVTDDLALRRAIESNGRTVVGTIGILFRAYKQGIIDKLRLSTLINMVFDDSTLYLNSAFMSRVLGMVDSAE
ncbi:MAG: DUF3368 domain-containing protein [Desulfuromonadaceae bacterium]